ncbi:MAG: IS110 family transposase [Catenibacterium sp.]|uniref:IS110 family transposase n=1 Tax=Catenibacterium sp. TaxID=2049022 RepID=UPI003996C8F4
MKIVRPICCGMDVHKNIIVATIGITNKKTRITEYIQETFSTLNPDLLNLKQWLINHKCFDACMESTGKYWIPIFNILEDEINIYLTHPKYVKAIKGKKTDKKDSKWISDLFKHDLIKFSFIPPKEIRALREISRYRYKLVGMRSSERNRYQNCMTVSNIGIGSVFSDPFGKSAQAIMKEVLESDIIEDEKILKCIHGSCKNKDKILDSIKHCNIETDQRFKMNESMTHMEELQVHINNCEIEIMKRAAPMFDRFMHITQLPGISTLSAILIISEIGVDMKQFESDKQLACWAGLALANNESANKKNQFVFLKHSQYLKPLLVQCALGAIKDKEGYFGIKYSRIKKRRGHKKSIIAIARMMLVSIYHMILTGETFNPSDYESFKNPKPPIKQQVLTEESAIEFLKKSGFDVSKLTKP